MPENIIFKVINATSKLPKDIVVIDASVESDSPKAFYYDQDISIVQFTSNNNCLTPGNTDEIIAVNVKKDDKGNSLPSTFIIAEAQTLAPLKVITFKADISDVKDITITDTTVTNINVVFDFNKNIIALPGSELASGLAALDYNSEDTVNNYFNKTKNYKTVTLEDWHLVQSYYNAFPYGWANDKNTFIYLYSGSFDDEPDTKTATSIGLIKMTNNWELPMSLDKSNDFKAEVILQDGISKPLFFSNGIFYDDADIETARIRLAGAFVIPNQITIGNKENDIVTFLSGTINSRKAFGVEGDPAQADNQNEGGFPDFFDTPSVEREITIAMCMIGIGIAIGILVKLGQVVKWYKHNGNSTVPQEERTAQIEQLKLYIEEKMLRISQQINDSIVVPRQNEIPAAQQSLKEQQLELKATQAKTNINKIIEAQYEALELLSGISTLNDLQIAFDDLGRVDQLVHDGDITNIEEWVTVSTRLLDHNSEVIRAEQTFLADSLTREGIATCKRSLKVYEDTKQILEKTKEEIKEIREGADEHEIIEEEG